MGTGRRARLAWSVMMALSGDEGNIGVVSSIDLVNEPGQIQFNNPRFGGKGTAAFELINRAPNMHGATKSDALETVALGLAPTR